MKRIFFPLAFAFVLGITFFSLHTRADDDLAAKMLDLFSKFDAGHKGALSPEEQTRAVASVKQTYGDEWARQIQTMFAHGAGADKSLSAESWRKEVAAFGQPIVPQTIQIPMGDGKKLATDLYLPHGEGPFPVILARTPYGRVTHNEGAENFAKAGYVLVNQDMRGRFDSQGENLPFVGCGWNEHQDGVETIEWIKRQKWCNGKIATIGGSAGGITQDLLAGAAPEGLKAQYISVAAVSLYSATYIGGAFRKADTENWLTNNKFDPQALSRIRGHPSYDDYWKRTDTANKFTVMNVPAVHIGGWFDMFCQGTIDEFEGRQHQGATGSRGTQKLIMGPWTHGIGKMPAGELTFPKSSKPPEQYNSGRWFDHYLKGMDNGVEKEPAVAYYVMGDTFTPGAPGNEWRYADEWPIPAKETPIYFSHDSRLGLEKPAGDAAPLEFTFDPENPCPTVGGNNLTIPRGPMNQNAIESRHDGVTLTSEPLDKPVEVTGRVRAKIFVASSAADTDLSVRLCDVYPDGRSYLIAEGMLRLRYRNAFEKPELLTPGKIEEVTVDCWSTSIIFNKGHRVRATITSSNFPRFDVNPGTGEPWSDSGAKVKQTNRIYCDAEHPSHMVLPMVAN